MLPRYTRSGLERRNVEGQEHLGGVRQVANNPADRQRLVFDEGWRGAHLAAERVGGLVVHIDDGETVPAIQVGVAQPFGIGDRPRRELRCSADEEREAVVDGIGSRPFGRDRMRRTT